MFKTNSKYYDIREEKQIYRKSNVMAGDLIISIFKNLGSLDAFHIIKKRTLRERRLIIFIGIVSTCSKFPNFTNMGYYYDRRNYTITMVNLWKYTKFFHLLEKEEYELFVNFLEFLIDYWILCDDIKTYKHYLNTTNLVYDYKIQLIFKNYIIFSKSNIRKFLVIDSSHAYYVNNSIFLN